MTKKHEQVAGEIVRAASAYFAREINVRALVTVTRAELSHDRARALIFLSVLPESKEGDVLRFAKRARSDFRKHVIEHSRIRPVPIIDFLIDEGEKKRRRIDELTRKKNK